MAGKNLSRVVKKRIARKNSNCKLIRGFADMKWVQYAEKWLHESRGLKGFGLIDFFPAIKSAH